jgi:hypothetical protein
MRNSSVPSRLTPFFIDKIDDECNKSIIMSYLNGGWARWRGLPVTGARFVDLSHLSFE